MDTEIVQGDDLRLLVTVKDQDGQLVDISGASEITYAVAKQYGAAPAFSKTLTGGDLAVTNDSAFYLDVTAMDSGALDAGVYVHECEVITSGGLTYTTLQGRFRVLPQIIN